MADRYAPVPVPVPGVRPVPVERVATFWTWTALLFALIGVAGTIWLSLGLNLDVGMELIPCPLCYYQRTFVFAIAAVLLLGLLTGPRRSGYLSLITMPLTAAGLGIAGMHVYLEYDGKLECPDGAIVNLYEKARGQDDMYEKMHEVVTAPKESLAIFGLIFLVQLIDLVRSASRGGFGFGSLLLAIIVGAGLAAGAIFTTTKDPIPPWPQPIKGCRKLGPAPP